MTDIERERFTVSLYRNTRLSDRWFRLTRTVDRKGLYWRIEDVKAELISTLTFSTNMLRDAVQRGILYRIA